MLRGKKPPAIWMATVFIMFCSIALVVFALAMIMANFGSHPSQSTAGLNKSTKANIFGLAILVIAAALAMVHGVYRLLVMGQRGVLFALLGIPLAIGCVGETIDLFGTATIMSDVIGFGILLLFAIPLVLLSLSSSNHWANSIQSEK